ncbi:MAG: glycerol-3-phosphate 1-O-acyltransferase PlsY [Albidovulum sp.]|nr:glycerol-3-phosphate 1-O-acyltransferase PlsY [Albidovulum sp.]MDE0531630.1 glycerol-3-phosphate 1-O-acyltransferase PlsY [Albidovulum sp.]
MILPQVESEFYEFATAAFGSYLLGSVAFGVLVTKLMGIEDPRKIGSGNSGATNVLRTGSKLAAALTLILDAGKGAAAVAVCYAAFGGDAAQLAGLAAFLGHLFPAWHSFKGGKGVATFLGVLLALHPATGIALCLSWLAAALAFRISSVSALAASISSPLWIWILGRPDAVALCAVLAVLVWIRHAPNLKRLAAGEEPRIDFRKKS